MLKSVNEGEREFVLGLLKRECLKRGAFQLSSGVGSSWLCDLMEARRWFKTLMELLAPDYPVIGIATGGAFLAYAHDADCGIVKLDKSELYLPRWAEVVSLVDDVTTSGRSFAKAERLLASRHVTVGQRLCVLDRRPRLTLPVRALVRMEELGLHENQDY